jgi:hypothetical protein
MRVRTRWACSGVSASPLLEAGLVATAQLVNVLWHDTHGITGISQCSNGPKGFFVLWIFPVDGTNKDVRISDNVHLVVVFAAVQVLPAQTFG